MPAHGRPVWSARSEIRRLAGNASAPRAPDHSWRFRARRSDVQGLCPSRPGHVGLAYSCITMYYKQSRRATGPFQLPHPGYVAPFCCRIADARGCLHRVKTRQTRALQHSPTLNAEIVRSTSSFPSHVRTQVDEKLVQLRKRLSQRIRRSSAGSVERFKADRNFKPPVRSPDRVDSDKRPDGESKSSLHSPCPVDPDRQAGPPEGQLSCSQSCPRPLCTLARA